MLDADTATLMDFRVDQSKGLHFIYALPFSSNHLFIESTMISNKIEAKEWYRDAITEWLTREGIEVREKLREEVGVIPMQEPQKNISRAPTIGGASGAVRLSSGYAFSAIQTQMTRLTEGIVKGNYKVPAATSSHLNFMDRVFNDVLISNPRLGVDLFMRTAGALKGDQFAHFMLGSASLTGWLKVISAMPKWPFIKAVWRQVLSHD
jgi:lycopene beta-cyclase